MYRNVHEAQGKFNYYSRHSNRHPPPHYHHHSPLLPTAPRPRPKPRATRRCRTQLSHSPSLSNSKAEQSSILILDESAPILIHEDSPPSESEEAEKDHYFSNEQDENAVVLPSSHGHMRIQEESSNSNESPKE